MHKMAIPPYSSSIMSIRLNSLVDDLQLQVGEKEERFPTLCVSQKPPRPRVSKPSDTYRYKSRPSIGATGEEGVPADQPKVVSTTLINVFKLLKFTYHVLWSRYFPSFLY